ncbi:MAG: hypothetical protein COA58_09320 [Bacteroidetes bacterium]|nr:MAG: hypothetical protein COA58_09320 [Bacteroidota bacterium]
MKKILLALFVLALIPSTSNAQMWLTLKGGGGLATVGGYTGSVGGLAAGGGLGYKHQISKRVMIEGDILLDTRAVLYPNGLVDTDGKILYYTGGGTYIQVPITVQYMIPFKKKELIPYRMGQPKSYWFLEGGPYISYGTGVLPYFDPTIIALWAANDDPISEDNLKPRKIDFGITAGLGINFSIRDGKNRLIVGGRTNYGMLSIYKDKKLGKATNLSMVGYLALDFSLTKRKHIRHRW